MDVLSDIAVEWARAVFSRSIRAAFSFSKSCQNNELNSEVKYNVAYKFQWYRKFVNPKLM